MPLPRIDRVRSGERDHFAYPRDRVRLGPAAGASIDRDHRRGEPSVLLHEAPDQKLQTEAAYEKSLHAMPDDDARDRGVNLGVRRGGGCASQNTPISREIRSPTPGDHPSVYVSRHFRSGVAVRSINPAFLRALRSFVRTAARAQERRMARDYNETKTFGAPTARFARRSKPTSRAWATALRTCISES